MNAVSESFAIVESFKTRAEAVSAQVHRVATSQLALELVIQLLRQEGVEDKPAARAVWAQSRMIGDAAKQGLLSAVPGLTFRVTRELAADAKVGISQMDWALANTGTLVQTADAVDTRLVSTLPLLHIALVSTAALLPDLPALLPRIDPRRSAYLSFITGPSRTADIERVLTIGVHGPARLIIVLGRRSGGSGDEKRIPGSPFIDALANPNLTGALGRFSEAYRVSRAKAYEGIDFEAVRTQIADIKSLRRVALRRTGREVFRGNAEARGAKVFRTSDPQAVNDYILKLARENGVQSIVKSKSMASEEIHLNQHLEKAGIEVNETDLGEWIIQLAGQRPSHMVMPAIHMTKEEVAEVFSKKVEEGQQPDIPRAGQVGPRQAAPQVPAGRHGHHRRQHRGGRDRQHRHHHQRRQRAAGDHPAADPRGDRRRRKADRALRRHRADPHGPAQERHRAAADQLRFHHQRPRRPTPTGRSRSCTSS